MRNYDSFRIITVTIDAECAEAVKYWRLAFDRLGGRNTFETAATAVILIGDGRYGGRFNESLAATAVTSDLVRRADNPLM